MVQWSNQERAIIKDIFSKADFEDIGPKALCRCLIVYPWTQRYFSKFGDLSTPALIQENAKVKAHGTTVLSGLKKAATNLGNIKVALTDLSILHSDTLEVDPDNFKLLSDCFTIVIAGKMGAAFRPDVQVALQKFLAVVVSALGRQYW